MNIYSIFTRSRKRNRIQETVNIESETSEQLDLAQLKDIIARNIVKPTIAAGVAYPINANIQPVVIIQQ